MTPSAEDTLDRFNEVGCSYGRLTEQKLEVISKCADENKGNVKSLMGNLERLYIVLIVVTFFSGASAMGYILEAIKFYLGGK